MSKILLFRGNSLGFDRDMVTFSVKYGDLPNFFCKGIVDTGCPYTIINENTIKKTRISYCSRPTKCDVQLGNIAMELRELGICELSFRDENGNIKNFEQVIYIGIPKVKGYLSQELPSFIGKDFLNNHSLSIVNKKDGANYLLVDDD